MVNTRKNSPLNAITWIGVMCIMLLGSCKQSSDVVSNHWIQKRKHRPGLFVQLPAKPIHGLKATKPGESHSQREVAVEENQLSINQPPAAKQDEPLGFQEGKTIASPRKSTSQNHHKQLRTVRSAVAEITAKETTIRSQPPNPEDEDLVKSLTNVSKVAALLSAFAAVFFTLLLVFYIINLGNVASFAVTGLFVLAGISIVAILISLAISYLLYEKYDSEDAMIWTYYAAIVIAALGTVFSYLFYIAAVF